MAKTHPERSEILGDIEETVREGGGGKVRGMRSGCVRVPTARGLVNMEGCAKATM